VAGEESSTLSNSCSDEWTPETRNEALSSQLTSSSPSASADCAAAKDDVMKADDPSDKSLPEDNRRRASNGYSAARHSATINAHSPLVVARLSAVQQQLQGSRKRSAQGGQCNGASKRLSLRRVVVQFS
jgi:hypothetical protein